MEVVERAVARRSVFRVANPWEPDLVCFSHLRWDFVYQRPQHLMTRFSRQRRVFFIEEPVPADVSAPSLGVQRKEERLWVITPRVPSGLPAEEWESAQRDLVDELFHSRRIDTPVLWYYTPMALPFSSHLPCSVVVYDCMDELGNFKGAPSSLREREASLMRKADVVFTGGHSLFEAKRGKHRNVYPFPSSVDVPHFRHAREIDFEPEDQAAIPHPRIGFFGVIDERMDVSLLRGIAETRSDWHFVMIGPVVKIDPASLPQLPNLHYLGGRSYADLPRYLSGWEAAILPFAKNESTLYISPTKTPEYLAAGRPVVSTSIRDVVRPYQDLGLVHIADTPETFIRALEDAMEERTNPKWIHRVDDYLSELSWDKTWREMSRIMRSSSHERQWIE